MCSDAERERGREREREGGGGRGREAGVMVDNHERLARREMAGRPTLNQRHQCVNLPWRSTFTKTPKPTRWCSKAGRLSSEAVQPWEAPTATSARARRRRVASDMSWRERVTGGGGPIGPPSFPASAQTLFPHVRSHWTRTIQRYHPHCNELTIPNRATAKRARKTSKLSQLHATNFARICIDVHVQVLRDRVVAKLAKTTFKMADPSNPRWR